MIEPVLVRRLSLITLVLAGAVSAAAFAAGSPKVAGGVAAGAGMGLLPVLSWSVLGSLWLGAHPAVAQQKLTGRDGNRAKADRTAVSPLLFGAVSLGKLAVYAAALFFLVGGGLVDPLAFAGALIAPSLLLGVISLRRGAAL